MDPPDPDALPTGRDLVQRYLTPLAATPELADRIRTGTRVVAVTRRWGGQDPHHRPGRPAVPGPRPDRGRGHRHHRGARSSTPPAPGGGRTRSAPPGYPRSVRTEAAPWLAGPLPDVLGRDRAAVRRPPGAGRRDGSLGREHAAGAGAAAAAGARHPDQLGDPRGSPARLYGGGEGRPAARPRALGGGVRAAVQAGTITLLPETTIGSLRPGGDGSLRVGVTSRDGATVRGRRRGGRCHRVPPGPGHAAGGAAAPGPRPGGAGRAGAVDRPELPFLRDRAAARRRACCRTRTRASTWSG